MMSNIKLCHDFLPASSLQLPTFLLFQRVKSYKVIKLKVSVERYKLTTFHHSILPSFHHSCLRDSAGFAVDALYVL